MDPKMSLEIASFLEIAQAFDKWTEKWLFSATSALCLFISLINADSCPCEEVLEALTRRGAFVSRAATDRCDWAIDLLKQ